MGDPIINLIDKEDQGGKVAAVRRGLDVHTIWKANNTTWRIPLARILSYANEPMRVLLPRPKVGKGTKDRKKCAALLELKTNIKEHAHEYYVTSERPNEISGLTFVELAARRCGRCRKELIRLFTARSGKKVKVLGADSSSVWCVLKIAEVKIYGSEAYEFLDSGAVPNILYKSFTNRLLLIAEDADKGITIYTG